MSLLLPQLQFYCQNSSSFPYISRARRCNRINKIKLVSQNGIIVKCSLDSTAFMIPVTKRQLFSCIAASLFVAAFSSQVHAAEGSGVMVMKGMTANGFNPIRYSGRWFEVASLKKGFAGQGQEDCHCTQGIYTFDIAKSVIQVDTFCVHGGPDGYITGIRGNVQCLSEEETDKSETDLERQEMIREKCYLRFPTLPFIPKQPYDVIATDYDNFALVSGAKDRSFVQIYSRTPNPGPAFVEKYKSYLANYGYDPSKIKDTPQDCPEMSDSQLTSMMSQSGMENVLTNQFPDLRLRKSVQFDPFTSVFDTAKKLLQLYFK